MLYIRHHHDTGGTSWQQSKQFRGIFTIPSTPFQENGEIDIPSFRRVVDFCVECGAHGLVFPVNASEFTALSDAERYQLVRDPGRTKRRAYSGDYWCCRRFPRSRSSFRPSCQRYRCRWRHRDAALHQARCPAGILKSSPTTQPFQMPHKCRFSSRITHLQLVLICRQNS